jgi:nitroimidazol reductase NimA-like FMN-containing flavoprotein (pyridoxamine 5'-phosphate oxidase superfamily)
VAKLSMSPSEREAFLADLHVGVLSVADPDGGAPVTAPIWYSYELGGTVNVIIGPSSQKARALAAAGTFALCAQEEALPYRYVTVDGPVVETAPVPAEERAAMAVRYMGEEMGAAYIASTGGDHNGSLIVRMQPTRWRTIDYGKEPPPTTPSAAPLR